MHFLVLEQNADCTDKLAQCQGSHGIEGPPSPGCDATVRLIELLLAFAGWKQPEAIGQRLPVLPVSPFHVPMSGESLKAEVVLSKYDLAIIGSGPGGYVAAIRAAQWGLKTVVVEKDGFLGGTCLHVGCIPTKIFLQHAEIYETFQHAKEFGIEVSGFALNWPAILERKDRIVHKHAKGIEFLFRKNKVETIQGWGRWKEPGRVTVERDGQVTEIEATNILFAAGSEARSLPGVEIDGKVVLSNREILQLPRVPQSMIIVGAGAVGLEFASIFRSFGAEVTLLEMLPRIAPLEDEEISAELDKLFRKRGIRIFTEAKVDSVQKDADAATVTFRDKAGQAQTVKAEHVLMAVGRAPKTDGLGLDKTRAKIERGFVQRARKWRLPSPAFMPLAISWRACRNSRTPPPWKASSPWGKWPASKCRRSTASVFPMQRIASRRSARWD